MYNAISKVSRSGKPIPVSGALRDEIVHWHFLDTWDGFLPWKNEKHSSITLFSDASDVGWGGSIRVPGKEDQLIRGYWDDSSRDLPIAVREAKALLYTWRALTRPWQTQDLTVSSTTKPLWPHGKNKPPRTQFFLEL